MRGGKGARRLLAEGGKAHSMGSEAHKEEVAGAGLIARAEGAGLIEKTPSTSVAV